MPSFFNQTEFENEAINDSNHLLDTKTMTLEFVLFDTETKRGPTVSIGLVPKVVFGILLLIVETLGNYLFFCMVWYEKFGMDSKKRTITNQLLSSMILALIFYNIFFMPLFFGALLIPYSKYFIFKGFLNSCLQHIYLLSVLFIFSN